MRSTTREKGKDIKGAGIRRFVLLAAMLLAAGCAAPLPAPDLLAPTDSQMKLRSFQTRSFSVADRATAMRGVIAALQDLGFIIERANEPLGLVTAARFAGSDYYYNSIVGITVTVRQEADKKFLIRANAVFNNKPIEDAKVYQNFFTTLERALFTTRE
jgi:hypothetical protein